MGDIVQRRGVKRGTRVLIKKDRRNFRSQYCLAVHLRTNDSSSSVVRLNAASIVQIGFDDVRRRNDLARVYRVSRRTVGRIRMMTASAVLLLQANLMENVIYMPREYAEVVGVSLAFDETSETMSMPMPPGAP